jgi:hypothetical protein
MNSALPRHKFCPQKTLPYSVSSIITGSVGYVLLTANHGARGIDIAHVPFWGLALGVAAVLVAPLSRWSGYSRGKMKLDSTLTVLRLQWRGQHHRVRRPAYRQLPHDRTTRPARSV